MHASSMNVLIARMHVEVMSKRTVPATNEYIIVQVLHQLGRDELLDKCILMKM